MHSISVLAIVGLAISLAACASSADNIEAAYVSPINYQTYTCTQLQQEAERVSQRAIAVSGQQDRRATGDAVATGVALVVFWPALFFIRGDSAQASEVARLKGEMEAIEKVSIQKNCGIDFRRS